MNASNGARLRLERTGENRTLFPHPSLLAQLRRDRSHSPFEVIPEYP
jgi:hypothetical protein